MTHASILHCSGGTDLVLLLTPLPKGSITQNPNFQSFLFFASINSVNVRDPFRKRKRRAPI